MAEEQFPHFDEHDHERLVHSHPHFHVTHNYSETARTFEHLASWHEHEHDHAPLRHSHLPHIDFPSEHRGEAHDHDHDVPVKAEQDGTGPEQAVDRAPTSTGESQVAPRGTASTAKKATAKKATAKKATTTPAKTAAKKATAKNDGAKKDAGGAKTAGKAGAKTTTGTDVPPEGLE